MTEKNTNIELTDKELIEEQIKTVVELTFAYCTGLFGHPLSIATPKNKKAAESLMPLFETEIKNILSILDKSHAAELVRVREVGQKLADWSRKYPRNRIYGYGRQPDMDGELIALEEEAKLIFPEIHTNQLTQEDK